MTKRPVSRFPRSSEVVVLAVDGLPTCQSVRHCHSSVLGNMENVGESS